MAAMKWWGWGDDGIAFTDADKPALAPFIKEKIGLDVRRSTARPVPFDALAVPDPALPPVLRAALEEAVGTGSVSDDEPDDVAMLCPKGDPNAKLLMPLRHRIRHHSVHSNARKDQSQAGKESEKHHVKTRLRD